MSFLLDVQIKSYLVARVILPAKIQCQAMSTWTFDTLILIKI